MRDRAAAGADVFGAAERKAWCWFQKLTEREVPTYQKYTIKFRSEKKDLKKDTNRRLRGS